MRNHPTGAGPWGAGVETAAPGGEAEPGRQPQKSPLRLRGRGEAGAGKTCALRVMALSRWGLG